MNKDYTHLELEPPRIAISAIPNLPIKKSSPLVRLNSLFPFARHPLSISDAPVVLDPVSDPDRTVTSSDDRLPEAVMLMTSPRYMRRLIGSDVGLFLAIDPQPGPEHVDDERVSEVHRYTLLVHQFKLPKP